MGKKKSQKKYYKKSSSKGKSANRFSAPSVQKEKETNRVEGGTYVFHGNVKIEDLAKDLELQANDVLKELFLSGKIVNINTILDDETIAEICINHNYDFKREEIIATIDFEKQVIEDNPEDLVERAPIVTIMGHVDHGKTTLIDSIRDSHIVTGEAGAITQEIGAYQKVVNGKKITFLDTPGHEAFSAMRQRGAQMTDIVVLVVAADDGVMPQTVEAIDHAKAAGVPIIVAINKMDKPGADPEHVKNELVRYDLTPEEWGGDTIMVPISAKLKQGISELLENILVIAELKELKGNPNRLAQGSVIEATIDKKVGPKASLLVQNGTLNLGDYLVVGNSYCKVRRITNEYNQMLKSAGPSTPVSIIGLASVPAAGDQFKAFETEKEAKLMAKARQLSDTEKSCINENKGLTIENIYSKISSGEMEVINLIIKADTEGSVQALKDSISKITVENVKTQIIHAYSGDVTEGDVILASASNAIILAFNVSVNTQVKDKADELEIDIRRYDIIYKLLEEMEQAMKGKLKPVYEDVVYGHAEVIAIFKSSKIGIIAGSKILDGVVKCGSKVKVNRGKEVVYEGLISSIQREKEEVRVIKEGFECGIVLDDFNKIEVGDILESWGQEVVK
jgi:translation initiation factor IF-2